MLNERYGKFHETQIHRAGSCSPSKWGLIIIVLSIMLGGCTIPVPQGPTVIDKSFVTNNPCSPPCWYGLKLDVSNKEDVLATLSKLPFIELSSIREQSVRWNDSDAMYIRFSCISHKDKKCGGITIAGDKVKRISMAVHYELSLETTVSKLGAPDYVEYSVYHPEVGGCVISLEWQELGIVVNHLDTRNEGYCQYISDQNAIPKGIEVTEIHYIAEDRFTSETVDDSTRIPWPGFADNE